MARIVDVVLSDDEFDAVAATLAPDAKKTDDERVAEYFQVQCSTIAGQFTLMAKERAFQNAGLSPILASARLDADQESFLLADGAAKKAIKP